MAKYICVHATWSWLVAGAEQRRIYIPGIQQYNQAKEEKKSKKEIRNSIKFSRSALSSAKAKIELLARRDVVNGLMGDPGNRKLLLFQYTLYIYYNATCIKNVRRGSGDGATTIPCYVRVPLFIIIMQSNGMEN